MAYTQILAVQTHGGRCCGIKNIWNFPYSPSTMLGEKKYKKVSSNADFLGHGVRKEFNFHQRARPKETAEKRLKAVVAYIKKRRPQGLIEVVLTCHQLINWENTLVELGFKEVTSFKNSNTFGTRLHVFHLAYDND